MNIIELTNNRMYFNVDKYELEMLEDSRFSRLKMYIVHDKLNNNKSTMDISVIKDAEDSLINIPILANIIEADEDFGEHDMEYDEEEDRIEFIEKPIGLIPAVNHNYHYEDIDGKTYAVVYGYIWNIYAQDAASIINRDKDIKLSVEMLIDDSKYDEKTKILDIKKFRYTGITLLGKKYETGMVNAHALLQTFAKTSEDSATHLDELNNYLMKFSVTDQGVDLNNSNFDIDNLEKEEDLQVPKRKEEIAMHFKLTSNQLNDELERVLRGYKFVTKNWYGESVERDCYYLRDYDESFIYFVDVKENYLNKKAPYSMKGDNVEIDFTEAKRIKYSPVDWSEGDDEEANVIVGFSSVLETESTEKVNQLKDEIETLTTTFTTQLSEKEDSILEMGKVITEVEAKFSQSSQLLEEKEKEIEKLNEEISKFKQAEDDEKVEALFAEYALLVTEEEKNDLKEKRAQFSTFELFQKEFKSFVCDRVVNKAKEHKVNFITMGLHNESEEDVKESKKELSHWDRLQQK